MKVCTTCNIKKPVTEYFKASRMKDGLQSRCKECSHKGTMASRHKKPAHYRAVQKQLQQSIKDRVDDWKQQQKCLTCNEDEVACLDLHHLDPAEKDGNISDVIRLWKWERIEEEIKKCVVLCSNCHRKVHAGLITLLGP